MSSDKLTGYLLTPKAIEDLENIWRYSAETWSVDQADIDIDGLGQLFDGLVQTPFLARAYRVLSTGAHPDASKPSGHIHSRSRPHFDCACLGWEAELA